MEQEEEHGYFFPLFISSLIHFDDSTLQFFQQCLCFLQVFGVKPFGEPAIDLRQHLPGFFLLALALPQLAQSHHRP